MYGYIYKTIIPATKHNPERFYIGQHKGLFTTHYKGSGVIVRSYIKTYGKNILKVELLEYANSQEELNLLETKYINENIDNPLCVNISKGGVFSKPNSNPNNKDYIKIGKKVSNKLLGYKIYNNGIDEIHISKNQLPPVGYNLGRLKHRLNNLHNHTKNNHWWNNGIKEVFQNKCPKGFTKGRLKIKRDKLGRYCKK